MESKAASFAKRLGLSVQRYPPPGSLARQTRNVLQKLKIDCVIDVGAHYGEYGSFLRESGFQGQIISFEPSGDAFEKLSNRIRGDKRWSAQHMALGATEGTAELLGYNRTGFNSFLTTNEFSKSRFGIEVTGSETVPMRRLDSVFDEIVPPASGAKVFLKMDTQGFDLEVLKGASGRMSSIFALQSEVSVKPVYDGMPSMNEALETMRGLGFELAGFFPVSQDRDKLRVIEFDVILVRGNP